MATLTDSRVAFLATDGFEDSELTSPWEAVQGEGASATLIAPDGQQITGKNGHVQHVDLTSETAKADEFDALVLPGGVVNADHLRLDKASIDLADVIRTWPKPEQGSDGDALRRLQAEQFTLNGVLEFSDKADITEPASATVIPADDLKALLGNG